MCKGMIIIGNNVAKCKVERVASGLIFTDSATGSVLATFLSNEDIFERGEEPKLAPDEEKIQDLSTYKDNEYSEKIGKLLAWTGSDQRQLAGKLCLSQSQISRVLNGKYEGLRWSTKQKINKLYEQYNKICSDKDVDWVPVEVFVGGGKK